MLMDARQLEPLLRAVGDPVDRGDTTRAGAIPVLIDFDRSVLVRERTLATAAASPVARAPTRGARAFVKTLLSPEKRITRDNVDRLLALVRGTGARPRILVIGGGTVGQGVASIYAASDVEVIAFDIYASPDIHFIGDAHDIPLRDDTVDGVIVQAVLEHVLEPGRVADEIWRVLKPDGLVYSETPFMQHVHEGAYDFTRFTESGHRYLFRRFDVIASGVCGGAGTQLAWSIDYYVRSLFRSRIAGKLAKLAVCWLHWTDRLIPESFASDAASGFYFLGRKSAAAISPHEAVAFYRGAQRAS